MLKKNNGYQYVHKEELRCYNDKKKGANNGKEGHAIETTSTKHLSSYYQGK
jgi:hypothetical protein